MNVLDAYTAEKSVLCSSVASQLLHSRDSTKSPKLCVTEAVNGHPFAKVIYIAVLLGRIGVPRGQS
jgi:hypothetical protein